MRARTIAVLSANPALGAILGREIEQSGNFRVPVFTSMPALSTFLRIAPVDVLVLSLDVPWDQLVETVRALKQAPKNASPLLEIIVLTHAIPFAADARTEAAAILTKPIPPGKLIEAIDAALVPRRPAVPRLVRPAHARPPVRPDRAPLRSDLPSNVIQLFGPAGAASAPR